LVDLNLVTYIRQLLQYGYNINSIRTRLLTSGYTPPMVDEAINYIYQGTTAQAQTPKASFLDHFKTKKFIIAISGIFGIIILAFLVLTLAGGSSEPIQLYTSPVSSQVTQGESFAFTKSILNAEEDGMVSFSYELIDIIGNTVITSQESANSQSIPMSSQINIPDSTPPGSYTLLAIARLGEQKSESSFTFTVLKKIEEVIPEEPEPETPEIPETGLEPAPETPEPEVADNDNDGISDEIDTDDDNDGIIDAEDALPLDHDNDNTPDILDTDADEDGILDKFDVYPFDIDNDGVEDISDSDNDNDGIPNEEDVYEYDFDNDGVLDKDDDEKSYEIPATQEEAELGFTCSSNIDCNDFDGCTVDACKGGSCENIAKTPCCGNFICESGETIDSCSQDCRETTEIVADGATPAGQERIEQILLEAEVNPETAAKSCGDIERVEDADYCYFELAKQEEIVGFCKSIHNEKTWDSCHMYFVINQDMFDLCTELNNRYIKNSCYSIESMSQLAS